MQDPVGDMFQKVGSEKPFDKLVDEFYSRVENDFILRPLYPADLAPSKRHLALFLVQRFGGPGTYSQERGHPRMRARHMPFKIGMQEKEAWMKNMRAALDTVPELQPYKKELIDYFDDFALFMVNQPN